MKKYFLFIIILIICLPTNAQKCKYQKNEIDEFTKNRVIITKRRSLYQYLSNVITVSGVVINDNKYLRVDIMTSGAFSIDDKDKIMFMLSDDNILELKPLKYVLADHATQGLWTATVDYWIDDDTFNMLSESLIKKVRTYTSNGYIEKKVKGDYQSNVAYALNCLIEATNKKF